MEQRLNRRITGLSLQRRLAQIMADLLHRHELAHQLKSAADRLTELGERVQEVRKAILSQTEARYIGATVSPQAQTMDRAWRLSSHLRGLLARRGPSSGENREQARTDLTSLLEVRKVMSARIQVSYTPWDERQGHTSGIGTSPSPGRPTRPGGILDRGGRRLPRRRPPLGAAVDRGLPARGQRRLARPARRRATMQVDQHPREDHPTVVGRQADGAWVPDRPLDRAAPGPPDPAGVRHRAQSEVPDRLAPPPRLHAAEAAARPAPARPGGDHRLVGVRLAAHQKKAPQQNSWVD